MSTYGPQRLYIGGLPDDVTTDDIAACFQKIGIHLQHIEIAQTGFDDGLCRGFAHGSCRDAQEAQRAVRELGYGAKVRGSVVKVQVAAVHWTLRPKEPPVRRRSGEGGPPRRSFTKPLPLMKRARDTYAPARRDPPEKRDRWDAPTLREGFSQRGGGPPPEVASQPPPLAKMPEPAPPPTPPPPVPKISPGLAKLAALKAQLASMKGA